ncbi:Gfo/Idh/MocA family oxidoreductase [Microbaculum marinum]|uniref:Gfo/Idh/MocA family oxidoreductase n=1 Tax=Microbaculum marinum TaxID=1764581 RepID=A0AAW9RS60_9HYPH
MTTVMHSPVRTAVVGLGYFGRFHAKHHAANPGVQLVAVCDVDPRRAAEVAGEFGGAPVSDHRELLGKVDAVSVAVPTSMHFDVAREFIEAGVHVLVEKPITDDVGAADRLVALAENRGVVLQVGHIERFSAAFRALEEKVERPLFIESRRISPWKQRATDVDVVLDLMIHDIDIVLGLVAAPVETVQAVGAPVLNASEDIANARLTFANGAVADITASRIASKTERQLRLFQRDSYLVCDFVDHRVTRFTRDPGIEPGEAATHGPNAISMESWDIAREDSLGNEIAEFLDCIVTKRRPTVDGRVGRDALHVAMLITDSIRSHRARIEASLAG